MAKYKIFGKVKETKTPRPPIESSIKYPIPSIQNRPDSAENPLAGKVSANKEELKTLKDIEDLMVTYDFPGSEAFGHKIIATEILKQEVIRWVKAIQSNRNPIMRHDIPEFILASIPKDIIEGKEYTKDMSPDSVFQLGMEYGAILFALKFNNLTKDDLK